ncbi:hypothetical protein [Kushneria indalinina]|uniref:Lipoprotein n=1 Tax=Kushneria indalinina DSM 14324 TaxID=1122140 RepID=A0A3D9DSM2_9GAMM|nr:hypothetical protein [Kushneria indalinina]REC93747.1 hypothetical protein C8D72_3095 [Kushneria indalinina DSM 14324]
MKKGLTMGALAAAVMLAAGCSSSGGAPENSGASQSGMSQGGQASQGNMSQSGGASRPGSEMSTQPGASETPTGTSHGSPTEESPGGGIDSNNDTMPSNTQSNM